MGRRLQQKAEASFSLGKNILQAIAISAGEAAPVIAYLDTCFCAKPCPRPPASVSGFLGMCCKAELGDARQYLRWLLGMPSCAHYLSDTVSLQVSSRTLTQFIRGWRSHHSTCRMIKWWQIPSHRPEQSGRVHGKLVIPQDMCISSVALLTRTERSWPDGQTQGTNGWLEDRHWR